MKRILALTPTYFPMMGGAERTVDEIYKRLSRLGYEIDLVTPKSGIDMAPKATITARPLVVTLSPAHRTAVLNA